MHFCDTDKHFCHNQFLSQFVLFTHHNLLEPSQQGLRITLLSPIFIQLQKKGKRYALGIPPPLQLIRTYYERESHC